MPVSISTSTVVLQAFRAMELPGPSSLSEDSQEGRAAAEHYDTALDLCLEAADWSFASEVVALAQLATPAGARDPRLPFSFALPMQALVLREIVTAETRHRVDGRVVRCDRSGPILARVTTRLRDETAMPATFRTAVALQLAGLLAPQFVEVQSKVALLLDRQQEALARAARTDARTASPAGFMGELASDWATEARW